MAQITITIPDAIKDRVINAFSKTYGWTSSNSQTQAQYCKTALINLIKDAVRQYEENESRIAVQTKVESEITLS